MLDKNGFKNTFRLWVKLNPSGNERQARAFCLEQIPKNDQKNHRWLIEECVGWFLWLQEQRSLAHPSESN